MNMKDVKAITIPQGTVKKIENSNGDIIWGSRSAFPYRRLEYIHFSGAEYIDTGYQPTSTTQFGMNVRFPSNLNETTYNGKGYMGARNRYAIGHDANGTYFFGLGNWVSTAIACDTTDFHTISIRPNGFTTNIGYKIDNGSWVNPGNISFVNGGSGTCMIGASNTASGAASFIVQDLATCELIENTTKVRNFVPCQRKTDNICGLYDTTHNVFYPMTGTTITSDAAGPISDEYWDLTN